MICSALVCSKVKAVDAQSHRVNAAQPAISYELSFEEAQAHYVDVAMTIENLDQDLVDLKMAVWAPGSYLIREFSKNVEAFSATASEQVLHSEKLNKNTWRVATGGAGSITVRYRVYAFEMSVRTSYINSDHAYLNGTSIFMYLDDQLDLPATIRIKPKAEWKKISTGLEADPDDPFVLHSPNYDILADSPIEIGNQDIIHFEAAGVPHEVAIYGGGNYDREQLKKDFTKVIEEQTAIFGENPCERYVFIVHFTPSGGGGLEHLNSTTLQFSRDRLGSAEGWKSFMGLMAHEYFHLWNVKRLRPFALGPFNYEAENYTHLLWFAEGFTAYYDDWSVRRIGLYSPEEYLKVLEGVIGTVENTPGNRVQPVTEASFDAWVKYYRSNENSYNTQISYYSKGAILGLMIDMAIREHSKGRRSIDDLMKHLYQKYYLEMGRGIKDEELQQEVEAFAGDMDEFFKRCVWGTGPVPYNEFFSTVGLKLVASQPRLNEAYLGARLREIDGALLVTQVTRGTAAYEQGLSVNDVIVTVDGQPAGKADALLAGRSPGDELNLGIIREGLPRTLKIKLGANELKSYRFEKMSQLSEAQQANYKNWLSIE